MSTKPTPRPASAWRSMKPSTSAWLSNGALGGLQSNTSTSSRRGTSHRRSRRSRTGAPARRPLQAGRQLGIAATQVVGPDRGIDQQHGLPGAPGGTARSPGRPGADAPASPARRAGTPARQGGAPPRALHDELRALVQQHRAFGGAHGAPAWASRSSSSVTVVRIAIPISAGRHATSADCIKRCARWCFIAPRACIAASISRYSNVPHEDVAESPAPTGAQVGEHAVDMHLVGHVGDHQALGLVQQRLRSGPSGQACAGVRTAR